MYPYSVQMHRTLCSIVSSSLRSQVSRVLSTSGQFQRRLSAMSVVTEDASVKKGIRGAIFDLDGTLCDSLSAITMASNYALKTLGHAAIPESEYRNLAGSGNNILMSKALRRVTGETPSDKAVAEAVALKRAFEVERGESGVKAFHGAAQVLSALAKDGVLLAVLSNKVEPLVKEAVKKAFPEVNWVAVCGAREDTPLKPSPVAALRILSECMPGVNANECVFVGDTSVDMQTGVAAGMVPIGVSWGFRTEEELFENGAVAVAKECSQIVYILRAWGKGH